MSVTFEVSKLLKFAETRFEHPLNIWFISVTLAVLNWLKFMDVNDWQL